MAVAIPVGAGDRVIIRMPSAVERRTYHLADDEPALEIVRSDGSVEIHGAGPTEVVFVASDPGPAETSAAAKRRRIVEDLRRAILAGALRPGDELPSEDHFTTRYNASRTTIRHALTEACDGGLVGTDVATGMLVVQEQSTEARSM
jgi:hypothetical protein